VVKRWNIEDLLTQSAPGSQCPAGPQPSVASEKFPQMLREHLVTAAEDDVARIFRQFAKDVKVEVRGKARLAKQPLASIEARRFADFTFPESLGLMNFACRYKSRTTQPVFSNHSH